ncbi:MAG TPA: hypothetical protein VLB01_00040 [Thermodesulfobacteriota bacterium]|nr:hypothetical protein [Thermodesulfobacteriota bacterium]
MSVLNRIKKALSPLTKEDPFFGNIRYQKVGFWEGKKYFAPEQKEYEITIDGGEDRPTESQRQFFRELELRYPGLKWEFSKDLSEQLRNWDENWDEKDLWSHFELESFGLPDIDAGQMEWELVYEHKESGHYFCIMMNGWSVEGIRIDG